MSVLEKAVSVMVPYFAALELGAVRAAVVMLGFAAAGMVGVGRSGVKEVLVGRKGVLGAVGCAVAWDMWRTSEGEGGLYSTAIMIYGGAD